MNMAPYLVELADFHFKPIEIYHARRELGEAIRTTRVVIIIETKPWKNGGRGGRVVFMLWCGGCS